MAAIASYKLAPDGSALLRAVRAFDPAWHIRSGINDVTRCLSWLVDEGFTPIRVTIETCRAYPLITIEVCPECEYLKSLHGAYTYGWEPQGGKRAILWRAEKLGCRIEWSERGN